MLTNREPGNQFVLDPKIHYLNHGSFGACPQPVLDTQREWQRSMEARPVEFLDRKIAGNMQASREALASFLGAKRDDIVYFPNPTTAINMVARNLDLKPGDEILSSDHEYGAMDRTWQFIAEKAGARYLKVKIELPVSDHDAFVEQFWSGVTESTRVIFLCHITGQTALIFPVAEICRRARQSGILTIIDGAHAPGQIPVDLSAIQPDIYTGACHKWMSAPKGSAFLYASPEVQPWLDPLVVSWGFNAEHPSSSQYVDYHEWQGTRDMSAFLSVPAAIAFQESYDWASVQARCHQQVVEARNAVHALTGMEKICPDGPEWLGQMAAIPLPELDISSLKARMYDEFYIEIPVYRWNGKPFLRISIQVYNKPEDVAALIEALRVLLPEEAA